MIVEYEKERNMIVQSERCIPITNNKMCEMCSKNERQVEREQVLDELVSVLASRLIIGTSLTTVQYKEVMHEIRFAVEELRQQEE